MYPKRGEEEEKEEILDAFAPNSFNQEALLQLMRGATEKPHRRRKRKKRKKKKEKRIWMPKITTDPHGC